MFFLQPSLEGVKFTCFRRGARVAELARLESVCTGDCTVGSNPTLSADIADCSWLIGFFPSAFRHVL